MRPTRRALTLSTVAAIGAGSPVVAEMPSDIVGDDNRVEVTDTKQDPARWIAALTEQGRSYTYCSGFFYAARTIATAGHCIITFGGYKRYQDGPVGVARAARRESGSPVKPYGVCLAESYHRGPNWNPPSEQAFTADYGAMKLDPQSSCTFPSGEIVLFDPVQTGVDQFTVAGYPGEKPEYSQWKHSGIVGRNDAYYCYSIDTTGGQSGSPVYREYGGTWKAIGIHNYGFGAAGGSGECGYNSAKRLTGAVINHFEYWRQL